MDTQRARLTGLVLAFGALALTAHPANAEPPVKFQGSYTADASLVAQGPRTGARYLDDTKASVDVNLHDAIGWSGATAHAEALGNFWGTPNALAGTIQGVDNIEVSRHSLRLFEAWVDQSLAGGRVSVRAGLYDLNSEFYADDSASLLMAPAFGIGSELAATGPNGPSIFPSTGLAVRLRLQPNDHVYAEAAVINAKAGVLGDPGGVDVSFGDGALLIGEVGLTGKGKIAVGAWRYTKRQDDIRDVDSTGAPAAQIAQGFYVLAERPLVGGDGDVRQVTAFARIGVSDADTTPFQGGYQVGLLINRVFASRPDSAFSIGFDQAFLSRKYRANARDSGQTLRSAESQVEITYSDRVAHHLTLQPDLQWIHRPSGDPTAPDAIVMALRASFEF